VDINAELNKGIITDVTVEDYRTRVNELIN